ncbi:TetR/AcrR family transcriptional regulator [Actinomadura logoneensis]|uniref:TetR/AcrR family transcriptional regulator n=1 Tax=Actinomadura logoneensis TaxID=2293572 RepID=A0A372JTR5_9ACTN|nr:helix-turn-helix domain-containing protein [Actinomadura logoneensis]RFU43329.1 TetR/AcrR family transcriptional regulator [Actinomadura logoneensis]
MPSSSETTRDRILAAAIDVIKARGVVAATTKEIARAAGVSEGSLYNHFENKTALFGAALGEVTSAARTAVMTLIASAGEATVPENLARFASEMVRFYAELLPMTGPVLADPELIAWLRTHTPSPGAPPPQDGRAEPGALGAGALAGPVLGVAGVTAYLEAEQRNGRIRGDAPTAQLAGALLGSCQLHAFLTRLAGADAVTAGAKLPERPEDHATGLVDAVMTGHLA